MHLNVDQIPVMRDSPSFQTPITLPMPMHTSECNFCTTGPSYVPLTASLHAGALITGARLDVGLFAFLFIFLAENAI
jgi:hypothetical protein